MLIFAISIAFISLIPFIIAYVSPSIKQPIRVGLCGLGSALGLIHGIMMIELFNLSYGSVATYIQCLPYVLVYTIMFLLVANDYTIEKIIHLKGIKTQ